MADNNWDATTAAAISAGVETANMVSASSGSKKARKHASEENQKARDWNLQMWEKNNAWNEYITDPAYKMKRMKAANINPHLAYSNGSDFANPISAAPASPSAPMTPNVPSQYFMNSQPMLNSLMMQAQIANINADTKQKESTAERTTTLNGIDLKTLDNMSTVIDQENTLRAINIDSGKLGLNLTQENITKTKQEITNLISTNESVKQGIEESISRVGLNQAQTAKYVADLSVIREMVLQIRSQTNLNNESAKTHQSNRAYTNEATKSLRRENQIGEKYDLNKADNDFQRSSADVKTAVQMFMQAEKTNKILDKKITTQDYINDQMLIDNAGKTVEIGKQIINPLRRPTSTTTTRFDNEGNYQGHSTTRNHR